MKLKLLPYISPVLLVAALFGGAFAHAHHNTDELRLYPRDVSDPCVIDSLQVRVNVIGVTHEGLVKLELYHDDKTFLEKKGRYRTVRVAAEDSPQLICMNVETPGRYAVAGYHDVDGSRSLKKKWNFKPKEPFGLSNNPEIKELRMPKFEEAAFDVGEKGADIDFILFKL